MIERPDLIFPFVVFCIATLFTPGPNNVMLMTSALNFGLRRTLPHLFGVTLGFSFLVLCVGLGLGAVFTQYPLIYVVIKYAGTVYLLYLAWKTARSGPPSQKASKPKRPFHFFEAVAFQWINPKAWVMAIGAIASYSTLGTYPYNVILMAGLFGVLGFGSSFSWTSLGSLLQKFLHKPKLLHGFNIVMAILLVLSLYPVLKEIFLDWTR